MSTKMMVNIRSTLIGRKGECTEQSVFDDKFEGVWYRYFILFYLSWVKGETQKKEITMKLLQEPSKRFGKGGVENLKRVNLHTKDDIKR